MTTTAQRREAILAHIQTHQKGEVNHFAQQYNVSEVTIRNDLNYLEKKGCVTRCYGGALLNSSFTFDQPLFDKKQLNNEVKIENWQLRCFVNTEWKQSHYRLRLYHRANCLSPSKQEQHNCHDQCHQRGLPSCKPRQC